MSIQCMKRFPALFGSVFYNVCPFSLPVFDLFSIQIQNIYDLHFQIIATPSAFTDHMSFYEQCAKSKKYIFQMCSLTDLRISSQLAKENLSKAFSVLVRHFQTEEKFSQPFLQLLEVIFTIAFQFDDYFLTVTFIKKIQAMLHDKYQFFPNVFLLLSEFFYNFSG